MPLYLLCAGVVLPNDGYGKAGRYIPRLAWVYAMCICHRMNAPLYASVDEAQRPSKPLLMKAKGQRWLKANHR